MQELSVFLRARVVRVLRVFWHDTVHLDHAFVRSEFELMLLFELLRVLAQSLYHRVLPKVPDDVIAPLVPVAEQHGDRRVLVRVSR